MRRCLSYQSMGRRPSSQWNSSSRLLINSLWSLWTQFTRMRRIEIEKCWSRIRGQWFSFRWVEWRCWMRVSKAKPTWSSRIRTGWTCSFARRKLQFTKTSARSLLITKGQECATRLRCKSRTCKWSTVGTMYEFQPQRNARQQCLLRWRWRSRQRSRRYFLFSWRTRRRSTSSSTAWWSSTW